jgi:hypothetical protein
MLWWPMPISIVLASADMAHDATKAVASKSFERIMSKSSGLSLELVGRVGFGGGNDVPIPRASCRRDKRLFYLWFYTKPGVTEFRPEYRCITVGRYRRRNAARAGKSRDKYNTSWEARLRQPDALSRVTRSQPAPGPRRSDRSLVLNDRRAPARSPIARAG